MSDKTQQERLDEAWELLSSHYGAKTKEEIFKMYEDWLKKPQEKRNDFVFVDYNEKQMHFRELTKDEVKSLINESATGYTFTMFETIGFFIVGVIVGVWLS